MLAKEKENYQKYASLKGTVSIDFLIDNKSLKGTVLTNSLIWRMNVSEGERELSEIRES